MEKVKLKTLIVFLVIITSSCTNQKNIDWKKYDLITNIDELIDFFPDLNLDRSGNFESAQITQYLDGSKELVYEYELLESESHDPLYYSITIETTRGKKEAKESFNLTKSALTTGSKWGDFKLKEMDIEHPGELSYYALRTLDDTPNGLLYIIQSGSNVYSLVVSGLYSSDNSIITKLINPEIRTLDTFSLNKK